MTVDIRMRPGSFTIDSPIVISEAAEHGLIIGAGAALTTLTYTGNGPAIVIEPSLSSTFVGHKLSGFKLVGGGIEIDGAHHCELSELWITADTDGKGIWLHGDCQDNHVRNVHIQNCDVGFQVGSSGDSGDGAKQTSVSQLKCNQNISNDALLYYAQTFNWTGGLIQGVGGSPASLFDNCESLKLDGVHVEHTDADPSLSFVTCSNATLMNCRLTQANGPRNLVAVSGCIGFHWQHNRQGVAAPDVALETTNSLVTILQTGGYQELPVSVVSGAAPQQLAVINSGGSATFATAGTKSVSFAVAEPDANYRVVLGADANETFWVTSKTVNGFTLNSSNSSSTATVDWELRR